VTSTASLRHPLTRGLLALTFTTGVVDAVSYLGLGRVATWVLYVPAAVRATRG
jgi:uncharacterized membrane protein YoaK (UPF0700 family)